VNGLEAREFRPVLRALIAGTDLDAQTMAGAVGAGGLGDLAIRYGYERYETQVLFEIIVILITMVTCVQFLGERLSRRVNHRR